MPETLILERSLEQRGPAQAIHNHTLAPHRNALAHRASRP